MAGAGPAPYRRDAHTSTARDSPDPRPPLRYRAHVTTVEAPAEQRRASLEWTVRAAWLLALLVAAVQLIGVLVSAGTAIGTLTASPLTVSIQTAEPLHPIGQNFYDGPFIADNSPITATRVTADATNIAMPTRVGLAFGPLVWALTGAGIAAALTVAFGHLIQSRTNPRKAARAIVVTAAVTAVGTSAAQILDELGRTGLQGVMWHGSTGMVRLGAGALFTFQFGWLAVVIGTIALATVIARQDRTTPSTSR